jgi:uncharacterized membrane-anchored protein
MKNRKIIFFAYALIVMLVPIYIIGVSQDILNNGKLYKFRPQAYDPIDPLRGHYLRINYDTRNLPAEEEFEEGDEVYVSIDVDKDGYAFFSDVHKNPPKKGDYLMSTVRNTGGMERFERGVLSRLDDDIRAGDVGNYKMTVTIDPPDNMRKYFINEDYGLRAERAFARNRQDSYIGVRIKKGHARLQDIYIKKKPIMEFLGAD